MEQDNNEDVSAIETAYRRGWQQGFRHANTLVTFLQLKGYGVNHIQKLLTTYNDILVTSWRYNGNLQRMEDHPNFDIQQLEEIIKHQQPEE
jgi:hypothetical protein